MIGPSMGMASLVFEEIGVAQAIGFAVMVTVGGAGLAAGSALAGRIAEALDDEAACAAMAATCAITAAGVRRAPRSRRPA